MALLGEFSEAELRRFLIRYENGYDIKSDERYNAWLKRYHPTEKPTKKSMFIYMHNIIIVNSKLKLRRKNFHDMSGKLVPHGQLE